MKVNIILFGQLVDITGVDSFVMEDTFDTNCLVISLQKSYPAIMNAKYLIAVDKKVIEKNTLLPDNCTVALLPPFSGG